MSMLLPGPIGITKRTGRAGNSCAGAAPLAATKTTDRILTREFTQLPEAHSRTNGQDLQDLQD
jgi:hypothetical protein